MICRHEKEFLLPLVINGNFVYKCKRCGKWVVDMTPQEINTTTIDWSEEE